MRVDLDMIQITVLRRRLLHFDYLPIFTSSKICKKAYNNQAETLFRLVETIGENCNKKAMLPFFVVVNCGIIFCRFLTYHYIYEVKENNSFPCQIRCMLIPNQHYSLYFFKDVSILLFLTWD